MNKFLMAVAFLILSHISVNAIDMSKPIRTWDRVNHLTNDEMEFFESTWDSDKTLKQNQENIVQDFLSCCEFRCSNKLKKVISDGIREISTDVIGCELLRYAIATMKAKKIIAGLIFEQSKNKRLFSYREKPGRRIFGVISCPSVWLNDHVRGISVAAQLSEKTGEIEFAWRSATVDEGLIHEILHCIHKDINAHYHRNTAISRRFEALEKKPSELDPEMKKLIISCFSSGTGMFAPRGASIMLNDEEYRTMFGITVDGFDCLNEATYAAHKYKLVRVSHEGSKFFLHEIAEQYIAKNFLRANISQEKRDSVYKFLSKYGGKNLKKDGAKDKLALDFMKAFNMFDEELYKCYLGKDSWLKFPKFGVGRYKCRDAK